MNCHWGMVCDMYIHYIGVISGNEILARWRHQMETFSALLVICVGNSLVTGEFPAQRPVTRSSDVFFELCLNKWLGKQSPGWWFETPSCSLWCHCNGTNQYHQLMPVWWFMTIGCCSLADLADVIWNCCITKYCKTSNISHTLVSNKVVDY